MSQLNIAITSPNYWGDNLHQIFENDVQNPQNFGAIETKLLASVWYLVAWYF